ncbi:MAG: alpha/beta hydrolase, partial [Clostridiales Family XIII bacterium]|nr:alpha/beta hydrolase [Clostridiales Family XIII bacterium]
MSRPRSGERSCSLSVTRRSPLLLHGSNSNSAFWFPEILALSADFRVYAVDILGEAGNSEEYRLDLGGDGFADWLGETQEKLGVGKAALAGNSLGGWVALKFATVRPERVSRLILLLHRLNVALKPLRRGFFLSGKAAGSVDTGSISGFRQREA